MLFLFAIPLFANSQENSCGDGDPLDNNCPLDSRVYMLVLAPISVTLTGVFLRSQAIKAHEKNKNDNAIAINQPNKNAPSTDKQHQAA